MDVSNISIILQQFNEEEKTDLYKKSDEDDKHKTHVERLEEKNRVTTDDIHITVS